MSKKEQREQVEVMLSEPQNEVFTARSSIIADIAGQGAGKTVNIGLLVGWKVQKFPEAKGFIAANTYEQLSSSTLSRVFIELETVYGMTEYDKTHNPRGHYVVGVKPPKLPGWKKPRYRFKTYNNIMSFWNGAIVFIGSLDNYKVHDGKEFAWAHLDETKDTPKQAITDVLLGRLRQVGMWVTKSGNVIWAPLISNELAERQGLRSWNPLYIHTSPAEGSVEWLIDLLGLAPYEKEIRDTITKKTDYFFKRLVVKDEESGTETDTTVVIYSAYWNEANLPPTYIPGKKARMSKSEQLKFIYGYPFGRNGGEFFPGFDRFKHVGKYPYCPGLPLHTGWDFNATPYVTNLVCHVEYVQRWYDANAKGPDGKVVKYKEAAPGLTQMEVLQIRVIKEFCMPTPENTTEQTADAFADEYAADNPDVFVYGDASGHSRIEGLGSLTQYKIIANRWTDRLYLSDGYIRAKRFNIQVRKRRDLLNRIWEERLPEVEVLIDEEHCPNLIRDCEYLLQGKDGGKHKEEEKDKNGIKFQKLGHCADALEYVVCELCSDFIKDL